MDKSALVDKIKLIEGLTNDEKADLLGLLRSHKKYGLVWEEKVEDVEERLREQLPVLNEVKERAIVSDNTDAPNHILIEGDNLEALTALSYSHEGKIDVIYIDPPYNTGNKDFIYNDDYVNKENEFRHSKWISFMRRRLTVIKKLLANKGVLFISIGKEEVAQLTLLCNELFGENNQLGIVSRIQKKGSDKGNYFSPSVDYVLAYAKIKDYVSPFFVPNTTSFPLIETKGPRKGEYYEATKSLFQSSLDPRPNQRYYIKCPDGSFVIPPGNVFPSIIEDAQHVIPDTLEDKCWRWSWQSYLEKKDLLVFKKSKRSPLVNQHGLQSEWNIYTKRYQKDAEEKGNVPSNFIDDCINSLGTNRLSQLGLDFSFAKPCELIKKLIQFTDKSKSITILDCFAGSGTTLDATMQLNAEDGGNRQCILVTNNENKICEEVTYVRNQRVINGYTTPKGEHIDGLKRNTLRYYQTELLPREHSPRNMRELMNKATDLLCIKEDLYTEQPMFGQYKTHPKALRYFADAQKQMLILYREEFIPEIVEEIKGMDFGGKKLKIYLYSPGHYAFEDDFFEVQDKVELIALPSAIYKAYKEVLPKAKDKLIELANEETTEGGTL